MEKFHWDGEEEARVSTPEEAQIVRLRGVPASAEIVPAADVNASDGCHPCIPEMPPIHLGDATHSSCLFFISSFYIDSSMDIPEEGKGSLYTFPDMMPGAFASVSMDILPLIPHGPTRLYLVLAWHARMKRGARIQLQRRHYDKASVLRGNRHKTLRWLEERRLVRVHRRGKKMPEVELNLGANNIPKLFERPKR